MKVLIWFGCILVYSAAVAALNLAGVGLGGVPVALLAVLLIFLPAPAFCRLVDRRRQQCPEAAADPPAPAQERRPFPVEKVLAILCALFVLVACSLRAYHSGVEKGTLSAEALRDEIMEEGYKEGYGIGYEVGIGEGSETGYDEGYNDGYSDGKWLYYWEVRFFRNSACIVTTAGSKYHHYGCYHIGDSSYWIYNVELAEAKGYTPCLDCWEAGVNDESLLSLPPLG